METCFLGNKKAYKKTVGKHSDFYHHAKFYDVSQLDPELMGKQPNFRGSVSAYHKCYLQAMLAEKNIRYTKVNPNAVYEKHYLEQLQKRINETSHLSSLNNFFKFCDSISV